jgi:hypothetical protein
LSRRATGRTVGGMTNLNELVDRYVAVWNEPDADTRRTSIASLWTEDAVHLVQPTEEMVAAADGLRMVAHLQVTGHDALEERVTHGYEDFVGSGKFSFRRRGNIGRVGDAVKFSWEMVATGSGEVAGWGTDVVILAPDGRIRTDYQFIDG